MKSRSDYKVNACGARKRKLNSDLDGIITTSLEIGPGQFTVLHGISVEDP